MKICENCGKEHEGTYSSGRFCSKTCARGFSTKAKRKEINAAVSKKMLKHPEKFEKICLFCEKPFTTNWKKRNQEYCSVSCAIKQRGGWQVVQNKLSKEDWSKIHKRSYEKGSNYIAGGTTKWYDYKGIKVQGTYELRVCKILDVWKQLHLIKNWEYTKDTIQYIGTDRKKHTYLLDFKVFTDEGFNYYIEVKGYEKPNDILKWEAVKEAGNKLEVWFEKDLIKFENLQLGVSSMVDKLSPKEYKCGFESCYPC